MLGVIMRSMLCSTCVVLWQSSYLLSILISYVATVLTQPFVPKLVLRTHQGRGQYLGVVDQQDRPVPVPRWHRE